jgi:hypothetical protein
VAPVDAFETLEEPAHRGAVGRRSWSDTVSCAATKRSRTRNSARR